jgi:hypothetical protein
LIGSEKSNALQKLVTGQSGLNPQKKKKEEEEMYGRGSSTVIPSIVHGLMKYIDLSLLFPVRSSRSGAGERGRYYYMTLCPISWASVAARARNVIADVHVRPCRKTRNDGAAGY